MKRTKGIGPKGLGVMPSPGKSLEKVVKQLKGASQMHAKQAGMVQDHIDEMKAGSPAKGKKERMAKRAARKEMRAHNKSARQTEGTRLGQMLRRNFGSSKPKETETPAKLKDACYRKAKAKYDVFPSAYASGYIAKCRKRKGNIK
jgi:hypothetical protein